MMEIVILRGKSRRGRNKISEHGERWRVTKRRTARAYDKIAGPFGDLRLESIGCECPSCQKFGCQDWRWIFEANDPNFEIVRRENGS